MNFEGSENSNAIVVPNERFYLPDEPKAKKILPEREPSSRKRKTPKTIK
jgi:hypothetical protein